MQSEAPVPLARFMSALAKSRVYVLLLACLWFTCLASPPIVAQQVIGSIVGRVRVDRGDVPPQRILVTLEYLGAPRDSAYTDAQGTFGFHNLTPGSYGISVDDGQYEPVRRAAEIQAISLGPVAYVDITLIPKAHTNVESGSAKSPGTNPNLTDAREYSAHFPKSAVKEFQKGQNADSAGKQDEAIRHYEKAIAIAPDYYFAHNNLGSDYMSKSDFPAARKEFERVVELNQSDASAYFNLSNVCMVMGQLPEAQQYLGEGLRREADSAFGQFLLGSLDLRLKKLVEAETALLRAIKLDPAKAQYRLQVVNLLMQEGRKKDAASQLRDFLSNFPDSSFSTQAKQLLQRLEAHPQPAAAVPN
jgi:tetratricopeptide (TPR) repeat protein